MAPQRGTSVGCAVGRRVGQPGPAWACLGRAFRARRGAADVERPADSPKAPPPFAVDSGLAAMASMISSTSACRKGFGQQAQRLEGGWEVGTGGKGGVGWGVREGGREAGPGAGVGGAWVGASHAG